MKLSRLAAYGAAGIIGGLLFENRYLVTKIDVKNKVQKAKEKIKKIGKKHG